MGFRQEIGFSLSMNTYGLPLLEQETSFFGQYVRG